MVITVSVVAGLGLLALMTVLAVLCAVLSRLVQHDQNFSVQAETCADLFLSLGVYFAIIGFLPNWPWWVQLLVAGIGSSILMHAKDLQVANKKRQRSRDAI